MDHDASPYDDDDVCGWMGSRNQRPGEIDFVVDVAVTQLFVLSLLYYSHAWVANPLPLLTKGRQREGGCVIRCLNRLMVSI